MEEKVKGILEKFANFKLDAVNLSNFLAELFGASQIDQATRLDIGNAMAAVFVAGHRTHHVENGVAEYRQRVEDEGLTYSSRVEAAFVHANELTQDEYSFLMGQPMSRLTIGQFVQRFPDFVDRHIPVRL
jgi:hypothetical protein